MDNIFNVSASLPMIQVAKPKSPEPEATLTYPFLDKMSETNQLHLPNLCSQGKKKEMFYLSATCSAGLIYSKIVFILFYLFKFKN